MGAFEYTALDAAGKERKGVLEGDTARQIRQQLREQGLAPLTVEAVMQRESSRSGAQKVSLPRGISATDLALVTRQLATLVKAGLPLEEALHTTAQQTELPRLKSMILAVRSRVLEGHTLAAGLSDFPQAFPDYFRATIAAGEQSGQVDIVKRCMSIWLRTVNKIYSKFRQMRSR